MKTNALDRGLVRRLSARALPFTLLSSIACVGTTGSDLFRFSAFASGPPDASHRFEFDSSLGFHVTLTKANLHIGATYLTQAVVNRGSQSTSCIEPGIYVAQVTSPVDVDVLSPVPQVFSADGQGTADRALTGEVWLTGGDVNQTEDSTVILDLAGTASRAEQIFPFEGRVTIGRNHAVRIADPTKPGLNPICKRRIVAPIPVDLSLFEGGALFLRIDPRGWFNTVNFSLLKQVAVDPPLYRFIDNDQDAAGQNLFLGLRAGIGVYNFDFRAQ